jgi:hypothetical protein
MYLTQPPQIVNRLALYHACQMETLRKYWFLLFLAATPCAYVVTLVEPSWERPIEIVFLLAFTAIFLNYVLAQLNRIEGKLDAILKKLGDR